MKKTFLILILMSSVFLSASYAQKNKSPKKEFMLYAKIKGLSIAYKKIGGGPVLVLLHGGLNHNSQVWGPQIKTLSKNFTIVAWDAPGAGKSDDTPERFTLDDWADCLAELLDTLGIKQAHILGLSWGGVLAQIFYQRHPGYVLSLILCGTYSGWKGSLSDSTANARLTAALADASLPPQQIAAKYLPSMFGNSPKQEVKEKLFNIMSSDFHPIGFRVIIQSMMTDTRELLSSIKAPTLLIWGESDKRSPRNVAQQLHNSINGSKLEIISHAGHVSNMENPEEFNNVVKDFCSSATSKK